MNAKQNTTKQKAVINKAVALAPEKVVHQLNEDVRDSILVVSLMANAFVLIGWLVIQVSARYDAALINYLQNK